MNRKILTLGLPGSGKTTLTRVLEPMLNAVVFNNDKVRAKINRDIVFPMEDRVEQARRMGWLCDCVVESGGTAIADFICPAPQTRAAFGNSFIVVVDRIPASHIEDTNRMFVPPARHDVQVAPERTPQYWTEQIFKVLGPAFDPKRPTGLFVGRIQPFHLGHQRLIEEGFQRVGQVCIAVRDIQHADDRNPLSFFDVSRRIEAALRRYTGRFVVVPLPNISRVFYGRDVCNVLERLVLDEATEANSATVVRKQAGFA
jgi:cytidyltransferase-like protein